jgi:hypothetical protein
MANSSLSIKLVDGTTVTWTLPVSSWPDAQAYAQNTAVNSGFWDDNKVWHPASAILSVTVTP